jgi:redox-sensitive bicupin YhaK (pirin superfamily)
MPEQVDGAMEGFQLWLNLAAQDKMCPPWYRDIKSAEIPEFTTPSGAHVRVICGNSHGTAGAIERHTTLPLYLDIHLEAGQSFAQVMPAAHNAFIYVYRGEIKIEKTVVGIQRMAIMANDAESDGVEFSAMAPARALLIAGMPLKEPIAQYGPFVMNTQQQIHEAVADFQSGRFTA